MTDEFDAALANLHSARFDGRLANLTQALRVARGGQPQAQPQPEFPGEMAALDGLSPYIGSQVQDATPARQPYSVSQLPQMIGNALASDNAQRVFGTAPHQGHEGTGPGLIGKTWSKVLNNFPDPVSAEDRAKINYPMDERLAPYQLPSREAELAPGLNQDWYSAAKNTAHMLTPYGLYQGVIGAPLDAFYQAGNKLAAGQPVESVIPEATGFSLGVMGAGSMMSAGSMMPKPKNAVIETQGTVKSSTTGETLFANGGDSKTGIAANALARQDVDRLGYYSQLDRVLGSLNPKDSVTLDTLAKRGVKAAELEARGLLPDLKSGAVRVSDLQAKKGERLELSEREYGIGGYSKAERGLAYERMLEIEAERARITSSAIGRMTKRGRLREIEAELTLIQDRMATSDPGNTAKWQSFSLDPSNRTYKETVLHLPYKQNDGHYTGGHFIEPNIVGHTMTSLNEVPGGGRAYTLDQIQSDWGQKIRDGGVRDKAKIAELKDQLAAAKALRKSQRQYLIENHVYDFRKESEISAAMRAGGNIAKEIDESAAKVGLLYAELRTAEASASGHPLVNTTDQWIDTTLRSAINKAVAADAEYIAIPHGDTVLSYNQGKDKGMAGFYGTRTMEGIVPKNLRKLLTTLDKDSPKPTRVETLITPSGERGYHEGSRYTFDESQTGFTIFRLTDKVKAAIRDGQPLFANGGDPMLMNALARVANQPDQDQPNALARR
jgi:hypothetical protein